MLAAATTTAAIFAVLTSTSAVTSDKRLHSEKAEASSYLKSNWNKYEENYHPSYVLDDDPKTAWVEGVDGDGKGEWLLLPLSKLSSARSVKLVIANGYQKSAKLLEANAAPKQVTIVVVDGNGKETGKLTAALERKMGKQELIVPVKGGVDTVKLVVDDVHPGKVYKDLCISDVQVFADSDVPYNAKAENAKRDAMLAWKKERLATAKYFAKLPKEFGWASTTFEDSSKGSAGGALLASAAYEKAGKLLPMFADGIVSLVATKHTLLKDLRASEVEWLRAAAAFRRGQAPAGAVARRVEPVSTPPKLPDGVWLPDGTAQLMSLDDVVLVEGTGKARTTSLAHPLGISLGKVSVGDALVVKRENGTVESLLVPITTVYEERTTLTRRAHWVFGYDEAGRLTTAAGVYIDEDLDDGRMLEVRPPDYKSTTTRSPVESFELRVFSRNELGKIDKVLEYRGGTNCIELEVEGADCGYAVWSSTLTPR